MRSLKESLLNEVSNTSLIEKWLKKYNIKNYTITTDGRIDVDGNVHLDRRNLKEFPEYIQFGVVRGNFMCYLNRLESLRGVPKEVLGDFSCCDNYIKSLEGAPEKVENSFYCFGNNLTSLEGAPKEVGEYFDCSHNKLTSLEGAPKKVGKGFFCDHNSLTSLEGAPKEVGRDFDCGKNSVQFTEDDVRKVCKVGRKIIVITDKSKF